MSSPSNTADIIVLPTGYDPSGDEAPALRKRAAGPCLHREVAIDADAHRLFCRRCDAEVDPLDWISRLAGEWQRYITRREAAARRTREAEEKAAASVRAAQRLAARARGPMPERKRIGRTARQIARAQVDLADALAYLAEGKAPLWHLDAAVRNIDLARRSIEKLLRERESRVETAERC